MIIQLKDLLFIQTQLLVKLFFNLELDKVDIFSINGQKLLSFYNVRRLEINLEKGLYLIRMYKEGISSNHKIIIN